MQSLFQEFYSIACLNEKGRRALYNKSENPSHKRVLKLVLLATRTDTFLECRKTAEKVPALVCQVLFCEFWGEILTNIFALGSSF